MTQIKRNLLVLLSFFLSPLVNHLVASTTTTYSSRADVAEGGDELGTRSYMVNRICSKDKKLDGRFYLTLDPNNELGRSFSINSRVKAPAFQEPGQTRFYISCNLYDKDNKLVGRYQTKEFAVKDGDFITSDPSQSITLPKKERNNPNNLKNFLNVDHTKVTYIDQAIINLKKRDETDQPQGISFRASGTMAVAGSVGGGVVLIVVGLVVYKLTSSRKPARKSVPKEQKEETAISVKNSSGSSEAKKEIEK